MALKKVTDMDKKISTFEIKMNEMYDYQINPNYVSDSLSELQNEVLEMEDRSCRSNVQVDRITEEKGEM